MIGTTTHQTRSLAFPTPGSPGEVGPSADLALEGRAERERRSTWARTPLLSPGMRQEARRTTDPDDSALGY
jgi:hypothetical protein